MKRHKILNMLIGGVAVVGILLIEQQNHTGYLLLIFWIGYISGSENV